MLKAFITGASGQDASYLAELLLEKGYQVEMGARRASTANLGRIKHIKDKVKIVDFDLLEPTNMIEVIRNGQYDEFYNLGAMSFVATSFKQPITTANIDGLAITHMLEAIRLLPLQLGNLEAKRDWGFAKDYVEAMYLMLQQEQPDDFVISTNETHTVKEFVEEAFKCKNIDIIWSGEGEKEVGYQKRTERLLVEVNKDFYRPAEVDILIGDYTKAKEKLGWQPKTTFKELVKLMMI